MQDLLLLHKDTLIAKVIDGRLEPILSGRLPLFLQRTGDVEAWLKSRAIDSSRTNSRLLKKALRLRATDDLSTVLFVNGATITDSFWVKPIDDAQTKYADIRFTFNHFDKLALTGDVNSFEQAPSRTPELTNTGSFEKCWQLKDGVWWMVKDGDARSQLSELLAYELGKKLGFPMAEYCASGGVWLRETDGVSRFGMRWYVQSRDFTNSGEVDFEPAEAVIGTKAADYIYVYEALKPFGEAVSKAYMQMCYFDALIYNFDRHEHNFGLLRDSDSGKVLGFAPLFDHNLALVANGPPKSMTAEKDMLIRDFGKLLRHIGEPFTVRKLSRRDIEQCAATIPWRIDRLVRDFSALLHHERDRWPDLQGLTPAELRQRIEPVLWAWESTEDMPEPEQVAVDYIFNRQARLEEQNQELLRLEPERKKQDRSRDQER